MNIDINLLRDFAVKQNKEFLFVTLSGAHIYGFNSPDSDYDLRGAHIDLPKDVLTLKNTVKTVEVSSVYKEKEMDLVSHEIEKYFSLLARGNNGYVLEQIFSPIVVIDTPCFSILKDIASMFICRLLYHHYKGFAGTQIKLISKETEPTAKSFLYLYRVLMTGIEVLNTGKIETNILKLNEKFGFDFIEDLIDKKQKEKSRIPSGKVDYYFNKVSFLEEELDRAHASSSLPECPEKISGAMEKLDKFFFDLRMKSICI